MQIANNRTGIYAQARRAIIRPIKNIGIRPCTDRLTASDVETVTRFMRDGNVRFRDDYGLALKVLAKGQSPRVAVIKPPIIDTLRPGVLVPNYAFANGLGEIFEVPMMATLNKAGTPRLHDYALGSLLYAVVHLGTRIVIPIYPAEKSNGVVLVEIEAIKAQIEAALKNSKANVEPENITYVIAQFNQYAGTMKVKHFAGPEEKGMLQELRSGNKMFKEDERVREWFAHLNGKNTMTKPHCLIISCSDSRVVPEIIYNFGIGEAIVIRTAGNIIGGTEPDPEFAGLLKQAVNEYGITTIIIAGHTHCGAIKATEMDKDTLGNEPQAVQRVVQDVRSSMGADDKLIRENEQRNAVQQARLVEEVLRKEGIAIRGTEGVFVLPMVFDLETGRYGLVEIKPGYTY